MLFSRFIGNVFEGITVDLRETRNYDSKKFQKYLSNIFSEPENLLSDLNPAVVSSFLKMNPQFLENYVTSSAVSRENFQKWQAKRSHTNVKPNATKKKQQENRGEEGKTNQWPLTTD